MKTLTKRVGKPFDDPRNASTKLLDAACPCRIVFEGAERFSNHSAKFFMYGLERRPSQVLELLDGCIRELLR
jgi:hypothetical protein